MEGNATSKRKPDLMEQPRTQRVEVVIPPRTLLTVVVFAGLVALAVLSLGTLLSIFVAGVLALGLDPVVAALVRRGWGRGKAAVAVLALLLASVVVIVLGAVGPLWDQVVEFVNELPAYWEDLTNSAAFQNFVSSGTQDSVRSSLKDLAAGLPDAAGTLLGIAGGVFGSLLSLVTLGFLCLFLLMERPTITAWLFGFASRRKNGAGARWSRSRSSRCPRRCSATWRSRSWRPPWPGSRPGRSACRSRSCWP
jgi:predicted PurR-regulated permease PerM